MALNNEEKLRILVISQYSPPDVTAAAFRIGESISLLKEMGHDVKIITATPHKSDIAGTQEDPYTADDCIRIKVNTLVNRSARAHIEQYLGFAIRSFFAARNLQRKFDFDVVWATSPPLFMALCTIPLKFVSRRPIVLDIRDIWPETAVNMGKVRRGSAMERFGVILEKMAYIQSSALTCVSRPMRDYLERFTKRSIRVVYNGVQKSRLETTKIGKPNPKVFCYAGNIGYAQDIGGLLRSFALAMKDPSMSGAELKLVGTGAVIEEVITLARELQIDHLTEFLGVKPKLEAQEIMRRAGTLLIPIADGPAFKLTVPSKVFDCMSLGRPIISTIQGEGKEILRSTGANIVVSPGNVVELSQAFISCSNSWNEY